MLIERNGYEIHYRLIEHRLKSCIISCDGSAGTVIAGISRGRRVIAIAASVVGFYGDQRENVDEGN